MLEEKSWLEPALKALELLSFLLLLLQSLVPGTALPQSYLCNHNLFIEQCCNKLRLHGYWFIHLEPNYEPWPGGSKLKWELGPSPARCNQSLAQAQPEFRRLIMELNNNNLSLGMHTVWFIEPLRWLELTTSHQIKFQYHIELLIFLKA